MEFIFTNGTEEQQELWREGAAHLLNLPLDDLPLTITVSFVDPSELPNEQTTLAWTTWTYGSNEATTLVRNDAPSFGDAVGGLRAEAAARGLDWSEATFCIETSAHEVAHAAYASLAEADRVAVAQMFGASTDLTEELSPEGSEWQDRVIEAIAETFKEAFVPRQFRVFPNRTNKTISYDRFPEFRHHFRVSRSATEEEILEPEVPFPVSSGATLGYRFSFNPSVWFLEYPIEEEPPVDVQFEEWAIRFGWTFKKWFTSAENPLVKIDETQMTVELIQAFNWGYFSGSYFGDQTWYYATVETPEPRNFENSHIVLFDPDEAFKGGRWNIIPGLPEEPFFFSGQQLDIHEKTPWVPPFTFGEDFTVPAGGDMSFHWQGGSFAYLGTRVAAGESRSGFPATFQSAYPSFFVNGVDIFRIGGFGPPDTPEPPNKGIEGYRLDALEGEGMPLEQASVYSGSFSLPTEQIIIPGEEEIEEIPVPPAQVDPEGFRRGSRPSGRPVSGTHGAV